jgi:hypothetical protein
MLKITKDGLEASGGDEAAPTITTKTETTVEPKG